MIYDFKKGDVVKIVWSKNSIHSQVYDSQRDYTSVFTLGKCYQIKIGSYITFIQKSNLNFEIVLTQFGLCEIHKNDIVPA